MSINRRTLSTSLHLKELDVVPKYTESISRRQGKKFFTQSENCATNKILNLFIKTFSQREWWMMGYYCGNDPSKSASHRLSAFEKHLEVLRTSVLDQALQTTLSHLKHNDSVSVPTKPKSLSRRLTLIFPRVGRLFISIFFHFIYLFIFPACSDSRSLSLSAFVKESMCFWCQAAAGFVYSAWASCLHAAHTALIWNDQKHINR